MKLYKVSYGSRIPGSNDYTYLFANSAPEALEQAKKTLDANRLANERLNQLGKFTIEEV